MRDLAGDIEIFDQALKSAVPDAPTTSGQPRARGAVDLSVKPRAGLHTSGTALADLRQSGSLKVLFPRVAPSAAPQAVLVNTAGGITGGDRFSISAHAGADTELTLTTQAAERAYRAQPGQTGTLRTTLSIGTGARLNWLPQETILFQGCALDRALKVDLAPRARFLMVEPVIFGRAAMHEVLTDVRFSDRVEIRRDGSPLFLDAMRMRRDVSTHMARAQIANGAGAMVSLLYVADDSEARLAAVRARLPETAGASLIRDDLLFLRGLASDSFALRQWLLPLLNLLTGNALPRPWMI